MPSIAEIRRKVAAHGARRGLRIFLHNAATRARGALFPTIWGCVRSGKRLRVGRSVTVLCRSLVAGDDVVLGDRVTLLGAGTVRLHDRVVLNRGCCIDAAVSVTVGENTLLGPDCYIVDSNHEKPRPGSALVSEEVTARPVTVGRNVWMGRGVTLVAGVTVGDAAVIGAGAVVTRDVPPGATVAGVPARPIGAPAREP